MKVDLETLQECQSEYLMEGFKQDKFVITSVDIDQDSKLTALVDIVDYAMPSDGIFHLSVITKDRIIGQLIIILIFYILGRKKDKEVYAIEQTSNYRKHITKQKDIKFEIKIKRIDSQKTSFYLSDINIEDGSFIETFTMGIKDKA